MLDRGDPLGRAMAEGMRPCVAVAQCAPRPPGEPRSGVEELCFGAQGRFFAFAVRRDIWTRYPFWAGRNDARDDRYPFTPCLVGSPSAGRGRTASWLAGAVH